MKYVGVGRRAVALIIDGLLGLVVAVPLAAVGGGFKSTTIVIPAGTSHQYSFALTGIPLIVTVILWLGYMTYAEGKWGSSVGKRATGIRVVRADGKPTDMQAALIRNLLRFVDGLFFYLVGAILIWNSPTRQRLGDRAAGTVVVPVQLRVGAYIGGAGGEQMATPPPPIPPPPPIRP